MKVYLPIAILLLLISAMLFSASKFILPPKNISNEPLIVEIPEGTSNETAGNILESKGVIVSSTFFSFYCARIGTKVLPGRYQFNNPVYPWYAARLLSKGQKTPVEIAVTIPEGKRLSEIAEILEKNGVTDGKEFLVKCRSPEFIYKLTGKKLDSLEGYLFPDTYKFKPNTDPDLVIQRMHNRLIEIIADRIHPFFDTHQWLILASIVEREAVLSEERPRIAAVFLNRLKKGMLLEADPTVRFAADKWDSSPVLYSDLESNSPYNTYKFKGLPPGPISSVSKASLDAVLNPANTNELYFVATGAGKHIFSSSYREHLANIASIRR